MATPPVRRAAVGVNGCPGADIRIDDLRPGIATVQGWTLTAVVAPG
jgi:hypothetical protein